MSDSEKRPLLRLLVWPLVVIFISAFVGRYIVLSAAQYLTEAEADAKYLTKESAKEKYVTRAEVNEALIKIGTLVGDVDHIRDTVDDINDFILYSSHNFNNPSDKR